MNNSSTVNIESNESVLSTQNPLIISFYKENPLINFEDANIMMINIFKMSNGINMNSLQKQININIPLNIKQIQLENGEDQLEIILNKIIPTANIIRNMESENFYDFMLMRENKQKILIESKDININVKNEQIELFINTCKKLKSNGIFISQNSGIINKYNYQIDIFGTTIIVYIHSANYDYEKIKIAFDIIDNVYEKIRYTSGSNDIFISKDLLTEINQEFQCFIKQKNELKNYIKDKENKLLNQLDDIKFNNLNNYLSSKFISNENIGIYKCDLCNFYTSNKLKGMAAHKRGCKKKQNVFI